MDQQSKKSLSGILEQDKDCEERFPLVLWDQPDLHRFIVTIKAPGLIPKKLSKPQLVKNGYADVTPLKTGMDVRVRVDDEKTKKGTIYTFKVVRFPSPVIWSKSDWKVEKDQVVITLKKQEEMNWMPLINRRGLDQSSSSSSSSSEEDKQETLGAAAAKPKKNRVLRLDDLASGVQRLVVIHRESKSGKPVSSSDDDDDDNITSFKSDFG